MSSEEEDRRACAIDPSRCPPGMTPAMATRGILMDRLGKINLNTLGGWPEIIDRVVYTLENEGLLPRDDRPRHSDVAAELASLRAELAALTRNLHAGAPEPAAKKSKAD